MTARELWVGHRRQVGKLSIVRPLKFLQMSSNSRSISLRPGCGENSMPNGRKAAGPLSTAASFSDLTTCSSTFKAIDRGTIDVGFGAVEQDRDHPQGFVKPIMR